MIYDFCANLTQPVLLRDYRHICSPVCLIRIFAVEMDSTVLMEGSLLYLPAPDTARHNHSYLISRRNSLSVSKIMLILASSKNLPPSPIDTDWNPVTLDSATFTQSHCVFDFIFQDAAILQNGFP